MSKRTLIVFATVFSLSGVFPMAALAQSPGSPPPSLGPSLQGDPMDGQGSRRYRVGPGDILEVRVFGQPDLNSTVEIDEEGNISSLPFLEDPIPAKCRSEKEIQKTITEAYSRYLIKPRVSVRVTDRRSRPPAVIYGAVRAPTRVQMMRRVRLHELFALAGGITGNASGTIQIMHTERELCPEPDDFPEQEVATVPPPTPKTTTVPKGTGVASTASDPKTTSPSNASVQDLKTTTVPKGTGVASTASDPKTTSPNNAGAQDPKTTTVPNGAGVANAASAPKTTSPNNAGVQDPKTTTVPNGASVANTASAPKTTSPNSASVQDPKTTTVPNGASVANTASAPKTTSPNSASVQDPKTTTVPNGASVANTASAPKTTSPNNAGVQDSTDSDRATLAGIGELEIYKIDTLKAGGFSLTNGALGSNDPYIRPGDIVIVTEGLPIYITGGVMAPREITWKDEMTLARALAMAGGLQKLAKGHEVHIYRHREGKLGQDHLKIDYLAIKDGKAQDVPLQAYDIIDVRMQGAFSPQSLQEMFLGITKGTIGNIGGSLPYRIIY